MEIRTCGLARSGTVSFLPFIQPLLVRGVRVEQSVQLMEAASIPGGSGTSSIHRWEDTNWIHVHSVPGKAPWMFLHPRIGYPAPSAPAGRRPPTEHRPFPPRSQRPIRCRYSASSRGAPTGFLVVPLGSSRPYEHPSASSLQPHNSSCIVDPWGIFHGHNG